MTYSSAVPKPDNFDLTITKTFHAPKTKVFKTWIKSRHIIHWWTPNGMTMISHKMDIHPGGIFRCHLQGNGKDLWAEGIYKEMIEPDHLAFTHFWEEKGEFTSETTVRVELTENNSKTEMVFYQSGFKTQSERDGHQEGWSACFDLLTTYLSSDISE